MQHKNAKSHNAVLKKVSGITSPDTHQFWNRRSDCTRVYSRRSQIRLRLRVAVHRNHCSCDVVVVIVLVHTFHHSACFLLDEFALNGTF